MCTLFFISAAYAQETHSTITDSGGSLLNRQNQALLHKMLDEARHTRGLIDAILPQGFHGTTCASGSKLLWRSSPKAEWYCQPETDGTVKAFGKTALPTCGTNEYLYPETPTQFGCRALNLKGAIGAAPAWQWSADGHSLRVQAPNGTWGPWVYLRGDSGCYYKWLIGAWSACSSSCGPGTQSRTVTCQSHCPAVTNVADSFCSSPKPSTSQACDPGYTFDYTAWSGWGTCSNTCGTGTQTRTRSCNRCDNTTVACSNCAGNSCSGSQACTDHSGCTYTWVTGTWSACSTSCGTGTQTRTVQCRRSNGENVADTFCAGSGSKPATSQSCGGGYTYSYSNWGGWSTCAGSCGSGTQTRTRSCTRCDGTAAACSNCGGQCSESQACSTGYTYNYSNWSGWGSCSTTCGAGTQTRTRSCTRCDGQTSACTNCGNQCSSNQVCTDYSGCSYTWVTGSWSACSGGCGSGTQTRTVTCRRGDGTNVADSYCGGGKPATSQSCGGGYTYSYSNWGSWSTCSATCGGGTQTRTRTCTRCDGQTAACSNCGGNCSENINCNTQPCSNAPCFGYTYTWGACEADVPTLNHGQSKTVSYDWCPDGSGGTWGSVTLTCNNGTFSPSGADCRTQNCFVKGTYVLMADGSSKPIETLKVGDKVRGRSGINTVMGTPNYDSEIPVYGFNGGKPFVTGGHPFWTQDGWKAIDPSLTPTERHNVQTTQLQVGDVLTLDNGEAFVVRSIDKAKTAAVNHVFNPQLDGDHTYYANGLLVHNKRHCDPDL